MSGKAFVQEILKRLGGADNITAVTNCMTRLRVTVRNEKNVDENGLKTSDEVLGIVHDRKNNYEIVVGPGKCKKYADELHSMGIGTAAKGTDSAAPSGRRIDKIKATLKIIGDIFVPLIPGVMTAGLCAGFASLLTQLAPEYKDNSVLFIIYDLLTLISASFMTYITAWAGYRAAQRFGATPIIGGMLGMITSLDGINKIALTLGLYNEETPLNSVLCAGKGGVLSVIFGVFLLSVIEKRLRRIIPDNLDIILTPFLSLIICLIPYIAVIMPVLGLASSGIASVLGQFCSSESVFVRIIVGYLSAALFLPLVAMGMHHGLIALYTVQLQELGFVTLYPALTMAGAGLVGASFAIRLKAKKAGNHKLCKVVDSGLPAGILGVGEPLIYGVTLPLGKPFITAGLGAGFGGAFVMAMQVASTTWGPSGILGVFVMTAGPRGAVVNTIVYLSSLVISYIGGFIITTLTIREKELIPAQDTEAAAEAAENTGPSEYKTVKHGDMITFDLDPNGFTHTIKDPYGIHARPAAELVRIAAKYDAEVTVSSGEKTASCKSLSELMNLGAGSGARLNIGASGRQSADALYELRDYMSEKL